MAADSKIEWCDDTINFWWGCMKVSEACKNCYAEAMAERFHPDKKLWGPGHEILDRSERAYHDCLKLNRRAIKEGRKRRVFVNSMSDTFESHPAAITARLWLWKAIAECDHLIFLLLTKRPENVKGMVPAEWVISGYKELETGGIYWDGPKWPENVWVGCTVENEARACERLPHLRKIPAPVRFLSMEPLEGHVDFSMDGAVAQAMSRAEPLEMAYPLEVVDWVIVGGESGPGATPMHPDIPRKVRDDCEAAAVPFFFKQWGEYVDARNYHGPIALAESHVPISFLVEHSAADHSEISRLPVYRVGKHNAGRLLDGVLHDEFPDPLA